MIKDLTFEDRWRRPEDPAAEAGLIGAMMRERVSLWAVAGLLPEHFSDPMAAAAFAAALEMLAQDRLPDPGNLYVGTLDRYGEVGAQWGFDCWRNAAPKGAVKAIVLKIKDDAARRALLAMATTVMDEAMLVSKRLTAKEIFRLTYRKLESVAEVLA